jgi:hypothetical protein
VANRKTATDAARTTLSNTIPPARVVDIEADLSTSKLILMEAVLAGIGSHYQERNAEPRFSVAHARSRSIGARPSSRPFADPFCSAPAGIRSQTSAVSRPAHDAVRCRIVCRGGGISLRIRGSSAVLPYPANLAASCPFREQPSHARANPTSKNQRGGVPIPQLLPQKPALYSDATAVRRTRAAKGLPTAKG